MGASQIARPGYAASIGHFEHKNWPARFNTYQATQRQLNKTAARIPQNPPQRFHPLSLLFIQVVMAPMLPSARSSARVSSDDTLHRSSHRSSFSETGRNTGLSDERPVPLHRAIRAISYVNTSSLPTTIIPNLHARVGPRRKFPRAIQDTAQTVSGDSIVVTSSHSFSGVAVTSPKNDGQENLTRIQNENYHVFALLKNNQLVDGNIEDILLNSLIKIAIRFFETDADALAACASQLQKANALYGEDSSEILSVPVQKRIIRRWLTQNIFGYDIEIILQTSILFHTNAMHLNSNDLNHFLVDQLIHSAADVTDMNAWILQHIFFEELPSLSYFYTLPGLNDPDLPRLQKMRLRDFKWGQIHAGLSFAQNLGMGVESLSIQEASELGLMLRTQLQEGAAPREWWGFFRLPAIIRYTQDYSDLLKKRQEPDRADMEKRALIYYAAAHEEHLKKNNPALTFKSAMSDYKTRSQLAQQIIDEQCPALMVSTYLNKLSLLCTEVGSQLKYLPLEVQRKISQNNQPKLLPNINNLYHSQVEKISNAYTLLDKLLLVAALNRLGEEGINRMALGQIQRVSIDFTAADLINANPFVGGNQHAREGLIVNLDKTVEFFLVKMPSQADQIYALQQNGQGYDINPIGEHAEDYHAFLTTDKRPAYDKNFKLRINSYGTPVKTPEQLLEVAVDCIAEKHRQFFSKQLYDFGYDKTTLEKITETILSFIPFYTCINAVRQENIPEAVTACSVDIVALIPLIGNLSNLSLKLAHILSQGGMIAARNAASEITLRNSLKAYLQQAGAQFFQYGLLPASQAIGKKELASLGLATLRTIDPGIELLGTISVSAAKQAMQLAEVMSPGLHKLHKLLPKLKLELNNLPPSISPDTHVLARLAGIDDQVRAIKLGGDQFRGQDIYVRLHPETGEPFGRKYVLLNDGTLDPVPIGPARRLHNILEYGLSGRYAPRQGANWAAKTTPVTHTLLRQMQQDISNGANLQKLASQYSVELDRLSRYITHTGDLTELGRSQFMLAEAAGISIQAIPVRPYSIMELPRSVLSGPVVGLVQPIDQGPKKLLISLTDPVSADEGVRKNFHIKDGRIMTDDGTYYTYDMDLNVFIKDRSEESSLVYFVDKNTQSITSLTLEEAGGKISGITIDQRTAVIKGLGIDLELSTVLNTDLTVSVPKKTLTKRISYLWVGDQPLKPEILKNLDMNRQIANEKGYKVYVYLSEKSQEVNHAKLVDIICDPATCQPNGSIQNQIKILETTAFYKKFKSSINFSQYQDAINGNNGVATNFASAADILRLDLLKNKGGLYMDVDDALNENFGDGMLQTEANGFVLPGLLSSKKPEMDYLFGTSFFGVHQGNTIIDAMLQEIHRRYQEPAYRHFYQLPRPLKTDQHGNVAYANKLSYLTGPDVFNSVLLDRRPALKRFRELSKLQDLCNRPHTSKILYKILMQMPRPEEITPLANTYFVGNLHSWEEHRKK